MKTEKKSSLAGALAAIPDPRVTGRCDHKLIELLVITVVAVLCGADNFEEIACWAEERQDWLKRYLPLENGVASHDTFGRVLGLIDAQAFEAGFRTWVGEWLPGLRDQEVVAIDGKVLRASRARGERALKLVSAWAAESGMVLGQIRAAADAEEGSVIPELLESLALKGAIVTVDAAGTYPPVAQAARAQGADYVLSVKANQPKLLESMEFFFEESLRQQFRGVSHDAFETVEKDHGRIETRRYWVFDQCACLAEPGQWPDLKSFAVVEAIRRIGTTESYQRRYYIGSIPGRARLYAHAVRSHWSIENRLHWSLDVSFDEDRVRAHLRNAGHNLALVRRMALMLLRQDTTRKASLKTKRLLASTSDVFRSHLLGLQPV